jgi:purine-binding chemotaxis protein CheW
MGEYFDNAAAIEHREPGSASPARADQYLTFQLAEEMYALGILNVREILEFQRPTRVPMMPDFIEGVIGLRGEVVPVIHLARRLGLPEGEVTKRTCVIIVEVEGASGRQDIGVMVDGVSEVLEIPVDRIRPAPDIGSSRRDAFVRGMGRLDAGFVILLAEDRLLSVDELKEVERISKDEIEADRRLA